jgi:hypothetical protein
MDTAQRPDPAAGACLSLSNAALRRAMDLFDSIEVLEATLKLLEDGESLHLD